MNKPEAKATLDVRMLQDEDPDRFLEAMRKVVNDSAVEVRYPTRFARPAGVVGRLDSEAYQAIEAAIRREYNVPTLPTMGTGATSWLIVTVRTQPFEFFPKTE